MTSRLKDLYLSCNDLPSSMPHLLNVGISILRFSGLYLRAWKASIESLNFLKSDGTTKSGTVS